MTNSARIVLPAILGCRTITTCSVFKFTTVECKKDDNGNCAKAPDGSTVWQVSSIEDKERENLREMSSAERKNYKRYDVASTWRLPTSDTGLRLLGKDPTFLNAIGNTLRFSLISVVLELMLGLIIAMVVNSSFKGRGLMRAAMLVPWAIPTVISAVLWQVMLRGDQTGIFNKLLMDLGYPLQTGAVVCTEWPLDEFDHCRRRVENRPVHGPAAARWLADHSRRSLRSRLRRWSLQSPAVLLDHAAAAAPDDCGRADLPHAGRPARV